MTNRKALEKYCKEEDIDLDVLTYQEIVNDYVSPGSGDIETVEDFTGEEMDVNAVAYWCVDYESFFFVDKDEDFSEEEIDRLKYGSHPITQKLTP